MLNIPMISNTINIYHCFFKLWQHTGRSNEPKARKKWQGTKFGWDEKMCYVIVTGRSLLWALLSLVSFMAVLAAVITPKWIVGPPIINTTSKIIVNLLFSTFSWARFSSCWKKKSKKKYSHISKKTQLFYHEPVLFFRRSTLFDKNWRTAKLDRNIVLFLFFFSVSLGNGSKLLDIPTVGIFNRCTRLSGTFGRLNCGNFNVHGFATDSSVFPGCWKASLFFLALGLTVMAISVFAAFLGCCVQSICRKSIFNLTGVVQAFAGKEKKTIFHANFDEIPLGSNWPSVYTTG